MEDGASDVPAQRQGLMQHDAAQTVHRHLREELPLKAQEQDWRAVRGRNPAGQAQTQTRLLQLQRNSALSQLKKILGKAPPISEVFLDD